MKWFTCIVHMPRHVSPVQWFHTRAETPGEAEDRCRAWVADPVAFPLADDIDVPLVFEGKLDPVRQEEESDATAKAGGAHP